MNCYGNLRGQYGNKLNTGSEHRKNRSKKSQLGNFLEELDM